MLQKKVMDHISHNKIKWVFVDFFDTLISRNCAPETIKMQWARRVARDVSLTTAKTIYDIRKEAERKISTENNGITRREFAYDQLCAEIYIRLIAGYGNNILSVWKDQNAFYQWSLQQEIDIEGKEQYINTKIYDLLVHLKKSGCRIAVLSDFYMKKEAFSIMLKNHHIDGIVNEVFVSCEYQVRKADGNLYPRVLEELRIRDDECIMIGNNRHADYVMAGKNFIKAFWVPYKEKKCIEEKSEIEKQLTKKYREYKKKSYVSYGFSLYYFIDNLYRQLLMDQTKKVYFFSREGEFLLELFNRYKKLNNRHEIEGKYIYVSRLSTFVPTLKNLDEEDFDRLFRQFKDLSLSSFLLSIGFSKDQVREVLMAGGITEDKILKDFRESQTFIRLKENKKFIKYYNEIRTAQRDNFSGYMKSVLDNELPSRIAVADVGWKGTMQDNIYHFFDKRIEIRGYYLGLSEAGDLSIANRKKGITFTAIPQSSAGFDIWSYDKSFYEKILYASHPATHSYKSEDNQVIPVLEQYRKEDEIYEYIRPFQEQIKLLFDEINTILHKSCYSSGDLSDVFLELHVRTLCQTGKENRKMQKALIQDHFSNWGEFTWNQSQLPQIIMNIFKYNKRTVLKRIVKEGLDIKYMYAGQKIISRCHLPLLLRIYTKMVCRHEMKKIRS